MWLEETLKQFKRILLLISHSQVITAFTPGSTRPGCSSHNANMDQEKSREPFIDCVAAFWLSCCHMCAQDFMDTVCTNILRLHQKKLIPYGGMLTPENANQIACHNCSHTL